MDDKKRFDTWDNQIDCNDCEPYWTGQCDGVPIGKSRNCTAFKATRSIVIPERLNSLEKRVKWLRISCLIVSVAMLFHLLSHLLGG